MEDKKGDDFKIMIGDDKLKVILIYSLLGQAASLLWSHSANVCHIM